MTVGELTATLAIPIDVEFRNSEGAYLITVRSSQNVFRTSAVARWWPEDREKIVVFLDERKISK